MSGEHGERGPQMSAHAAAQIGTLAGEEVEAAGNKKHGLRSRLTRDEVLEAIRVLGGGGRRRGNRGGGQGGGRSLAPETTKKLRAWLEKFGGQDTNGNH